MDVRALIRTKREGGPLSDDEIRFFMNGYVRGDIEHYQAAALVTAIFIHGLDERELRTWTAAMVHSGRVLEFPSLPQKKVDKHSTGGVGDKVSIVLAPAVAACGVCVPMISGRGLGHTGGTLDKLESIPGFRTDLDPDAMLRALDRTGVAFGQQTADLVPADRLLYDLRDATGLIESVPLIASSIVSKKLAEGIDGLVLDVKFGSGAVVPEPEKGRELARVMIRLARSLGLRACAYQTAMDRPLGRAVGHALEIAECVDCLAGGGPEDLRELVLLFGGEMLVLAGRASSVDEGSREIARAIDEGRALGVFELVVAEQGGDPRCLRDRDRLPRAPAVEAWKASTTGVLSFRDNRKVGLAVGALGGSRTKMGQPIDPAVGVVWRRRAGDPVTSGDVIAEIHHREGVGLRAAQALLSDAITIGPATELAPLVLARIDA